MGSYRYSQLITVLKFIICVLGVFFGITKLTGGYYSIPIDFKNQALTLREISYLYFSSSKSYIVFVSVYQIIFSLLIFSKPLTKIATIMLLAYTLESFASAICYDLGITTIVIRFFLIIFLLLIVTFQHSKNNV